MVFLALVLAVAVDFSVSAIVPARAERFRQWLGPKLKRLEAKADQAPGWLGTVLKGPFWASRKSLNWATNLGKEAHDKASD
jgi:hypothetical protein